MKKIILVQAPNNYGATKSSGCYTPLGILSISTYLFSQSGVKAKILDGELLGMTEIVSQMDNNSIIGFSVNSLNAQNTVILSQIAKANGAIVVWGGPLATIRWRQISINQGGIVDFVVRGDGEEAFLNIVFGSIQKSSNIACCGCNSDNVHAIEAPLETYPFPNYSLLPQVDMYIKNFENQGVAVRMLSVYTHRGCAFRAKYGPCVFCSITDRKLRFRDPVMLAEDIVKLRFVYDVTHLRDCGDSITGSKQWLKSSWKLLKSTGVKFYIYARADEIDEESADLLAGMGVEMIYLGAESGDDRILQVSRKKETHLQIIRAVEILGARNIQVRPSFIAGLPGESTSSMIRTKELLMELADMNNVPYIPFSVILPLPGSPIFHMMEKEFPDLRRGDIFDIHTLQNLWIKKFCNISWEDLKCVYQEIKSTSQKFNSGMGE